jgi:D-alanyl-D-alanine dipeptidase
LSYLQLFVQEIAGRFVVKKILIIVLLFLFSSSLSSVENDFEKVFIIHGLVDVQTIDPTINVDLVNSDSNKNFFRKDFYGSLTKCYVQKEVAVKLKRAQRILKRKHPEYSLLIYDGARPRSVSYRMFNQLKDTPLQRFVANPKYGSMHNYGAAVDLTIVDEKGKELAMGPNPFRKNLVQLAKLLHDLKTDKKLTKKEKENRALLKSVMKSAGFYPIELEWWHFNVGTKISILNKYKIIE